MVKYGDPVDVETYFADGSVNQSYLKQIIKGVDYLEKPEKELYYEEKGHFVVGGAVDVQLTQGLEHFNNQYFSSNSKKPSDKIMSMVHMVFDNTMYDGEPINVPLEDVDTEFLLGALDELAYQKRWKEETRIAALIKEGQEYFEELKEAHGKQVLDVIETATTDNIVMSLQSHPLTSHYFKDEAGVDVFFQVPIYFTYKGFSCKALLDMVRVDTVQKRIYPIDIKTLGDFVVTFPFAVNRLKYNFQGAFYTEALLSLIKGEGSCPIDRFPDLTDYTVMPFRFIVETTKYYRNPTTEEITYYQGRPMVYQLSQNQLNLGKYGRPGVITRVGKDDKIAPILARPVRGFEYALELHNWHQINGYEVDRDVAESDGFLIVP